MKKYTILTLLMGTIFWGCVGENSDGSSKYTYSSCSIVESNARTLDEQARDLNTCWDGVDYEEDEKDLASQWCKQKIVTYRAKYNASYGIQYGVKSTNCPSQ